MTAATQSRLRSVRIRARGSRRANTPEGVRLAAAKPQADSDTAPLTVLATQARAPLGGRVRALAPGAAVESLVLALAVPPLFLHATYQPHVSIPLGGTTVDVTLADAAIAAVLVAAVVRGRREGFAPLVQARGVLIAAAALVAVGLLSLATPAVLGEDYAYATHTVSALKFAWYALLLPAAVLLVRRVADARPLFVGRGGLERRGDHGGRTPVSGPGERVRGEAAGSA